MLVDPNGATRATSSHCDAAQQLAARLEVADGVNPALAWARPNLKSG